MSGRDTEAADWFARMRARDADADRAEFEIWRAHPDNAAAYARAERDWILVGGASPEVIDMHRDVPVSPARPSPRWALAAALLLALSLALAWTVMGQHGAKPVVAENRSGEIVLDDGTRVTLTDGATLRSQFGPDERRVFLSGGRARFTVAHDASRPFRVEAAGSETTALGTVFEIDLMGAQPVVHLIRGSVEVRAVAKPETPLLLRPGERATVAGAGPQLVAARATKQSPMQSPVQGTDSASLLIADELPLGAVIDRANHRNETKIVLEDAALASRLVSGRFDVADARSLSRKLAAALDIAVEERSGTYVLGAKIKN